MSSERPCVEVLLIQFWINDADQIIAALASTGLPTNIKRVDIEPAICAALGRCSYDLVIFDQSTPGLTIDMVRSCMRSHDSKAVLVVVDGTRPLEELITDALRRRQS
jgi:hypothetical protein